MFGSLLATRLLAVSFYHFNKPDVALSGHVGARCVRADVLHSCKYRVITDVIRSRHEIRKVLFWIHRLNGTTLWRAVNSLFALQGFHPPSYLTSDLSTLKQIPCRGIASHFLPSIPFCRCIIKHVFWKMKESYDKRNYFWLPSELPQSPSHFLLFISHFLLSGFAATASSFSDVHPCLCALSFLLPFHIFVPFRSVHSFVFVYQSRLFLSCRLNVLKQIYTINTSLPLYASVGVMFCIMCVLLYISICFCSVNGRLSSDLRTTSCCSSPSPLGQSTSVALRPGSASLNSQLVCYKWTVGCKII